MGLGLSIAPHGGGEELHIDPHSVDDAERQIWEKKRKRLLLSARFNDEYSAAMRTSRPSISRLHLRLGLSCRRYVFNKRTVFGPPCLCLCASFNPFDSLFFTPASSSVCLPSTSHLLLEALCAFGQSPQSVSIRCGL